MDLLTGLFLLLVAIILGVGVLWFTLLRVDGKVEETLEKHGGQLVAKVLKEHGIKYVFTLVGGHISPILVACEQDGIRVIDTRHEVTAVFAADGVARLTGIPGVAAVTAGPGLTNTITAVKNAQMAESPLLLIGGAAATLLKGRGALQDIDQMALFKPLCKFCATVTKVKDIVPTLRRALRASVSGVPGPVFVEFPIDVLYPYPLVLKEIAGAGQKKKASPYSIQGVVQWYLKNHVDRQFAGAWDPQPCGPMQPDVPIVDAVSVAKAAEIIRKAEKPVFLFGSQATLRPVAPEALKAAIDAIGVPCFLGGMARGLLGKDSALHIRQCRAEALKEADVIVLAGSVCDFRLGYGRGLPRSAKIIAVNRDRTNMLRNSDMFWKPTIACVGDVATFMVDLSKKLSGYECPKGWIATLQGRSRAKEEANAAKTGEKTEYINPLYLHSRIEATLSPKTILIGDGGDFVGTAASILRPPHALSWLDPGAFGTLGVGAGFALAAALVHPDHEVWIIYGDGTVGYSIAEYDTFVRHKLRVLSVVGNDACWTQIAREQVPMFKSSVACMLARTPYEVVAEGYGGEGLRVADPSEVDGVLAKARELYNQNKPVLINAFIGTTNFRDGSISV